MIKELISLLYIFVFLHQTATLFFSLGSLNSCISLFSYIKPQPQSILNIMYISCISLFSYIKPQLCDVFPAFDACCISLFSYIKPQLGYSLSMEDKVVYLCFPTSNRNLFVVLLCFLRLYIFVFLHQTATNYLTFFKLHGCISLFSYIKPQPTT